MSGLAAAVAITVSMPAEAAFAADALDPSFGYQGKVVLSGGDFGATARDVVVARNGAIIAVGSDASGDPETDTTLFGLRPNGELDYSFGSRGIAGFDEGDSDYGKSAVVQSTGDVVVVGTDSANQIWLARFNSDGSLDHDFGASGVERLPFPLDGATEHFAIARTRADRILVSLITDRQELVVTRRLPNGGPDRSFSKDGAEVLPSDRLAGGLSYDVPIAALGDGRVVVGVEKPTGFVLVGLAPDGEPDRSFAGDGVTIEGYGRPFIQLWDLAVRPNGALVVVGSRSHETKKPPKPYVTHPYAARFTADGRPDRSFGRRGRVELGRTGPDGEFLSVVLQRGGRVVAVGYAAADFLIARYRPDGRLDRSFSDDGVETTDVLGFDRASGVALERSGDIVAAGTVVPGGGPEEVGVVRYLGR